MTPDNAFDASMALALGVLAASYALIFTEILHRSYAALLGAVTMVVLGTWLDFYTQEQAMLALDGNTLLLLMSMMMLVALFRTTGAFEFIGIRVAKLAGHSPRRLLLFVCAAVSLFSMFLDNVTTVVIFAPLTVLVTRMLHLNPSPFLIGEAMMSNIGGAATLVGDPPNLMIGSAGAIDFLSFLLHMAPLVLPLWLAGMLLLLVLFRAELRPIGTATPIDLDEKRAIRNRNDLKRMTLVLAGVILLFFAHDALGWQPALAALLGAAVALAWLRPEPEPILEKVEWTVLLFFASLFVLVGGVEASGLLELLGARIAAFARDPAQLLATGLLLMWSAALISAVIDNIPFTVAMLPIISSLETQGVNTTPLWWALALGVGVGGNGTHIGATANLIAISAAERSRLPEAVISPAAWLRIGMPMLLVSLLLGSLLYAALFPLLS